MTVDFANWAGCEAEREAAGSACVWVFVICPLGVLLSRLVLSRLMVVISLALVRRSVAS